MTSPQERWDRRYAAGPGSTDPAAILDQIVALLPSVGTVVDVAGGSGRNAIWFARRGYEVTIVDASPVGLAHAEAAATAEGLDLECLQRDLEGDGMPLERTWDIAFMHLFFDRGLLLSLPRAVAPNGVLVFAQPTVANLERHCAPSERFLVRTGEIHRLATALADVDVLRADEAWRSSGRHEAWLVARKR